MRSLLLSTLFILFLSLKINAQCPVDPYQITNQTQLNQFQTLYPTCTELDGLIVFQSSAYDLSPLSLIEKIKGDVRFDLSFNFLGLSGMSSLKEIDGSFIVDDMDSILDFAGQETLEKIGGDFIVIDNSRLLDFDGLFSLAEIGGKLEIVNNSELLTITNVTSLQYLGLTSQSDLIIERNNNLIDLNGLQSIEEIKGKLSVRYNNNLLNIDGLSGIQLVNSTIKINDNDNLLNTNGLRNLEFCNNSIEVGLNSKVKAINFQSLKLFKNRLLITENPELRMIKGMNTIQKFDGNIYIDNNIKLDTIQAFNNLREAGNLLALSRNGFLPNFNFLSKLKRVNGKFTLILNYPTSLSGLDSLTRVDNNFEIILETKTMTGLENLKYVGGELRIKGDSLISLAALTNLDTVSKLYLSYNNVLPSLSGIDNIDATTLNFVLIRFNSQLSDCAVKSICDYLDENGQFIVGLNTGNCMDTTAIRATCNAVGINSLDIENLKLKTFVNQNSNKLEIRYELIKNSETTIRMYDIMGKLIANHPSEFKLVGEHNLEIPISNLSKGIYLVEVLIDENRLIQKISF